MDNKEIEWIYGLDSSGLAEGFGGGGSCEYSNKPLDPIKGRECLCIDTLGFS
jgi:hypothetical protein